MVAGVSAGSVIAAMYAFSQDPFWIEDRFKNYGLKKPMEYQKYFRQIKSQNLF